MLIKNFNLPASTFVKSVVPGLVLTALPESQVRDSFCRKQWDGMHEASVLRN